MNKHDTDPRYAGVVFTGTMDEAIAQAKAAPDHDAPRQTMDSVAHAPQPTVIPLDKPVPKGARFIGYDKNGMARYMNVVI
jgi:hypothetical protein